MESEKQNKGKQKYTHRENKLVVSKGRRIKNSVKQVNGIKKYRTGVKYHGAVKCSIGHIVNILLELGMVKYGY